MKRWFVALAVIGLVAAGALRAIPRPVVEYQTPDFSVPTEIPRAQRTTITARDGSVLHVLAAENRQLVPLSRIPLHVQWAFIAAEDHRFYNHSGVDGKAIVRALKTNRKAGRIVEGGSTITEQYVKNVYFPSAPRTPQTKVREAMVAREIERRMSKDEILEAYLNTIYLGSGAYGIQAAAETYFAIDVTRLTLAQGAVLAGIARSPEGTNPWAHPARVRERRDAVLAQMVEHHLVDPELAKAAAAEEMKLDRLPNTPARFPYFVDYAVRTFLEDPRYGATPEDRAWFLYRGGLEIRTSIDPLLQAQAETAAYSLLDDGTTDPDVGLATVDPATGEVLATVGGRNYDARNFDLATQGQRQAGSAFKTFALVAAIESGMDPDRTKLNSAPRTFVLKSGERWPVNNADGRDSGSVTLRAATEHSINAAYAELALRIGPSEIAGTAKAMGITSDNLAVPAMVLGGLTQGVSPLEMASAYGTLANGGMAVAPAPILTVRYADGRTIDGHSQPQRVMSGGGAWVATQVLRGVITAGTGDDASIGRPAAGKTGTTNDYADAWFAGYTPELATAVWVGYADARVSMRNVRGERVAGGTFPARIWAHFMSTALEGRPIKDFDRPVGDLVEVEIDPVSGLRARPWCRSKVVETARVLAPKQSCPRPAVLPGTPAAAAVSSTITAVPPAMTETASGDQGGGKDAAPALPVPTLPPAATGVPGEGVGTGP